MHRPGSAFVLLASTACDGDPDRRLETVVEPCIDGATLIDCGRLSLHAGEAAYADSTDRVLDAVAAGDDFYVSWDGEGIDVGMTPYTEAIVGRQVDAEYTLHRFMFEPVQDGEPVRRTWTHTCDDIDGTSPCTSDDEPCRFCAGQVHLETCYEPYER